MSNYSNFIQDFPGRCLKILKQHFIGAKQNDLEVTLLLTIASSGLIVPFERLKTGTTKRPTQHPLGDVQRYSDASLRLDALLNDEFLGSELHQGENSGSWEIGKSLDISGEPDTWDWKKFEPITKKEKTESILKILRNALAHGNIVTRGHDQVEQLVFLSMSAYNRPERGFDCIRVQPSEFKDFVSNWLQFLADARIPSGVVMESIAFAEVLSAE